MSYGLRITNPSGVLVFADAAPGFVYAGTTTVGTVTNGPVGTRFRRVVQHTFSTSPSAMVIPFLRLSSQILAVPSSYWNNGGNWTFMVHEEMAGTDSGLAPVTVDLFVFTPNAASTSSWGIEMFDASGNRGFSFNSKPLMFSATATFGSLGGAYSSAPDFTNISVPINTPAAMWCYELGYAFHAPTGLLSRDYEAGISLHNGSQVKRDWILVDTDNEYNGPVTSTQDRYAKELLLVDMASYL